MKDTNTYLHLAWYRLRDGTSEIAAKYIATARKTFPAAVPSLFGSHEPFRSLADEGDGEFCRTYDSECDVTPLFLRGGALEHGRISGWTDQLEARFQEINLVFQIDRLRRVAPLEDLREFFVRVADATGSFFAFAEVNDSPLDTAASRPVRGAWPGLPGEPQWLIWLSPEYASFVEPHLAAGVTTSFDSGVLHQWTDEPADLTEIRSWLWGDEWVPADLLPIPNPGNTRRPHEQAAVMPEILRAPVVGSVEWRRINDGYLRGPIGSAD